MCEAGYINLKNYQKLSISHWDTQNKRDAISQIFSPAIPQRIEIDPFGNKQVSLLIFTDVSAFIVLTDHKNKFYSIINKTILKKTETPRFSEKPPKRPDQHSDSKSASKTTLGKVCLAKSPSRC